MVKVFAPAKINLSLHVTGQRPDGYHLLDSLVTFADVGDLLSISSGDTLTITVDGPEAAGVPSDMSNLALRAAAIAAAGGGAALTLTKALPAAAGIGGGSADAAAAYRGMLLLREAGGEDARHAEALLGLGADVPMCLMSRPLRARGIGEDLTVVTLPSVPAVLVNPRVPVSTPDVFRALATKSNAPMPDPLPDFSDPDTLIDFLRTTRNDLEPPARKLVPVIARVLAMLEAAPGCRLARMSGSGATCFALFGSDRTADDAAHALTDERPDWWVVKTTLGDQSVAAMPLP